MTDRSAVDELLLEFRDWLEAARAEAGPLDGPLPSEPSPAVEVQEVGVYRLVEEFSALRHDLKLQTKSARGLQEQSEATIAALDQAIEQFRAIEPKEAQAAWAAGKPLAEALADLDEALDRGRSEIERARRRIVEDSQRDIESALAALYARYRWPARVFLRSFHNGALEIFRKHSVAVRRELFDALLEGYGLIQGRLRRALKAEQLRRIETVGKPVDPELMTVIEVVDDPEQPPGFVVDEVRRGYTWRGRLLRVAEVRASRTPGS
jgi:molecular chaperone GrpE